MTPPAALLASATAMLVWALPTLAAGQGLAVVGDPPIVVVVDVNAKPEPLISPPARFLRRIFSFDQPGGSAPQVAASDPIVLSPLALQPGRMATEEQGASSAPQPVAEVVARRLVQVPMPRLRPATPAPLAALADPLDDEGRRLHARAISAEITGSIAALGEQAPPPPSPAHDTEVAPPAIEPVVTAKPDESQAVPPAPAEPEEIAISDDLLGDPTVFFDGHDNSLDPVTPQPPDIKMSDPVSTTPATAVARQPPAGPQSAPYLMVRTLQLLQDQISQGSTVALAAQRRLRAEIDEQFAAASPAVWRDPKNAAAAITYVLSGGAPEILRRLSELDEKPAIDRRLLDGVLAYAEGDEVKARDALAGIDATGLPASMGAQVALAQSALAVRLDPQESMRLLAMARLLAPGTLVEEAALRREIFIADQMKQTDAVERLARRYLARFRHSVYAGNFRNRFAAAISHIDFTGSADDFQRLDDMLSPVEPAARGQLYLTVALAAVVKGNAMTGALAAGRALNLAAAGSVEEARARLYRAAGLVADSKSFDVALADLAALDQTLLSPSDRALSQMVADTIEAVRSGTEPKQPPPRRVAELGAPPETIEATPLTERAVAALRATDGLVGASAK